MTTHPAFHFIRPLLDAVVARDTTQKIATLNALAHDRGLDLRFARAPEEKLSAVEYETRIARDRELVVADNWHDLFNACVWLTFPRTKRAISELHVALGAGENNRRPRRRDVLTLFDESGVILLCEPTHCADFEALNEMHRWRTLFVDRRHEWLQHIRPVLFGHGVLEQLATKWHRGLTVKAQWVPLPPSAAVDEIDRFIAARIREGIMLRDNEWRIPLPLLGIPGWFAENEAPGCYDDTSIFRPPRARR